MGRPRPHAVSTTDEYLALVIDELEEQGQVLRSILDRLPEPPAAGAAPTPTLAAQPVDIREPDPAPAQRRAQAKATKAAKSRTTPDKET